MRFDILLLLITLFYDPTAGTELNVGDSVSAHDPSQQVGVASKPAANLPSLEPFLVADSSASDPNAPFSQNPDPSPSSDIPAASGKHGELCTPSGGSKVPDRLGKRESCQWSWQENPASREDFICPVNLYVLCCRGPVRNVIYTLGCSEYTNAADPRCAPWNVNCCLDFVSSFESGTSNGNAVTDGSAYELSEGVLCWMPLYMPF